MVELTIIESGDIEELYIGFTKDGDDFKLAAEEPPAKVTIEQVETE